MTITAKAAELLTVHVVAVLKNAVEAATTADVDVHEHQMAHHFGSLFGIDAHAAAAHKLGLVTGEWPDLEPTTLGRRLYADASVVTLPVGRANAWSTERLDEVKAAYLLLGEEK